MSFDIEFSTDSLVHARNTLQISTLQFVLVNSGYRTTIAPSINSSITAIKSGLIVFEGFYHSSAFPRVKQSGIDHPALGWLARCNRALLGFIRYFILHLEIIKITHNMKNQIQINWKSIIIINIIIIICPTALN